MFPVAFSNQQNRVMVRGLWKIFMMKTAALVSYWSTLYDGFVN